MMKFHYNTTLMIFDPALEQFSKPKFRYGVTFLLMFFISLTSFTTYFPTAAHNGASTKGEHVEKDGTEKTPTVWL